MICLLVVPLTIESSTSNTTLSLNSKSIGLSFCLTDFSRFSWKGIMKVLPIYLFFTKPSRYFTPSVIANCNAEVVLLSGIGITTSMSWSGLSFMIFLAKNSPILKRDLWTDILSIFASGLAKYTYSKIHGVGMGLLIQDSVSIFPSELMKTAEPAITSSITS